MELKQGFQGFDYMDELIYDDSEELEIEVIVEDDKNKETVPEDSGVPRCLICLHQIRHPICERCHIRELVAWMQDKDIPNGLKKKILKEVSYELLMESPHQGYCIRCYNEVPNICSYCFFYKVALILKENSFSKSLIDDFLGVFDYRQYNEDYVL